MNRSALLAACLLVTASCVDGLDDADQSTLAEAPDKEGLAQGEIHPGVWVSSEDGVTTWRVSGYEGHAWFWDELARRLSEEADPDIAASYADMMASVEAAMAEAALGEPAAVAKAKTTTVTITPSYSGLQSGYRVVAKACRDGLGGVEARAYSRINGVVQDTGPKSKWGWGVCVTATAEARDYSPTSCYAWGEARAGSQTVFRESYTCPEPNPCGNGVCSAGETCYSCPADCGACPPPTSYCGDGSCNGSESCYSCPFDCGSCDDCGPVPLPVTGADGSDVKIECPQLPQPY